MNTDFIADSHCIRNVHIITSDSADNSMQKLTYSCEYAGI